MNIRSKVLFLFTSTFDTNCFHELYSPWFARLFNQQVCVYHMLWELAGPVHLEASCTGCLLKTSRGLPMLLSGCYLLDNIELVKYFKKFLIVQLCVCAFLENVVSYNLSYPFQSSLWQVETSKCHLGLGFYDYLGKILRYLSVL